MLSEPLCHHPSPSGKPTRGLAAVAHGQSSCSVQRIAGVNVDSTSPTKSGDTSSLDLSRLRCGEPSSGDIEGCCKDSHQSLIFLPAVAQLVYSDLNLLQDEAPDSSRA